MRAVAGLSIMTVVMLTLGSGAQGGSSVTTTANIAPGQTQVYTITCTNSSNNLGVYVQWGRFDLKKDLALRVTDPNGVQSLVDNDPNSGEAFFAYAPVATGTWMIEVINQGSARVKYDLTAGFGN